jgi:hypothetical protein
MTTYRERKRRAMADDRGYRVGEWRCAIEGCEAQWYGEAGDGFPHVPERDIEAHWRAMRRRAAELRAANAGRVMPEGEGEER